MTLEEVIAAMSSVRAEDVLRTIDERFAEARIGYAVVGDAPKIGARLELAIDEQRHTDAVAIVEALGFASDADDVRHSRHSRGIVELHLHYVERRVLARERDLAWCSYLTKDEPPSREITPPDAEPFTL